MTDLPVAVGEVCEKRAGEVVEADPSGVEALSGDLQVREVDAALAGPRCRYAHGQRPASAVRRAQAAGLRRIRGEVDQAARASSRRGTRRTRRVDRGRHSCDMAEGTAMRLSSAAARDAAPGSVRKASAPPCQARGQATRSPVASSTRTLTITVGDQRRTLPPVEIQTCRLFTVRVTGHDLLLYKRYLQF